MGTMVSFQKFIVTAGCMTLCACTNASNALNPFYDPPKPVALLGEMNDHAINGGADKSRAARAALESMGTYQAALPANPNVPVIRPAVWRLTWVPDHLNRNGDLVPAHYYYMKVKGDQPAVTDAFELEGLVNSSTSRAGGNTPFVNADQSLR